jgi:hypothetical protein
MIRSIISRSSQSSWPRQFCLLASHDTLPHSVRLVFAPMFLECHSIHNLRRFHPISRISVIPATGPAIVINDVLATDTILSVKQRIFAANRTMHPRRQQLINMYGHGMLSAVWLVDDDTLARSSAREGGSGQLAVALERLSDTEAEALGPQVRYLSVSSSTHTGDRQCICVTENVIFDICAPYHTIVIVEGLDSHHGAHVHIACFQNELQLLEAARHGRTNEVFDLLVEGARVDFYYHRRIVRLFIFCNNFGMLHSENTFLPRHMHARFFFRRCVPFFSILVGSRSERRKEWLLRVTCNMLWIHSTLRTAVRRLFCGPRAKVTLSACDCFWNMVLPYGLRTRYVLMHVASILCRDLAENDFVFSLSCFSYL